MERSEVGKLFNAIAKINAAGNSSCNIQHALEDHHPYTGKKYYRIKEMDVDGSFVYSDTKTVIISDQHREIQVESNPASQCVTIFTKNVLQTGLSFRLLDMAGHLLLNGTVHWQPN